jgi:hypothetical protein
MTVLQPSRGTVTLKEMAKLVTDGSELCRRCRWGPSSKGGATTYLFHGALCVQSKILLVEFGAEVRCKTDGESCDEFFL